MSKPIKSRGWDILSAEDQSRMTALMRESPPARFMFGIRMSGYVPTATESELLAKWKALEERAQQAELFAAFRKAVED